MASNHTRIVRKLLDLIQVSTPSLDSTDQENQTSSMQFVSCWEFQIWAKFVWIIYRNWCTSKDKLVTFHCEIFLLCWHFYFSCLVVKLINFLVWVIFLQLHQKVENIWDFAGTWYSYSCTWNTKVGTNS